MSGLPKCGSCSAFIRWVVTVDDRRIPLDLAPSTEQGTVWIRPDGLARFLSAEERPRAVEAGHDLYAVHHQTCPSVERHRVPRAQTVLDLFGGDAA